MYIWLNFFWLTTQTQRHFMLIIILYHQISYKPLSTICWNERNGRCILKMECLFLVQRCASGRVVAWRSSVGKRVEFKFDYTQISLTRGHMWFKILSPGSGLPFFVLVQEHQQTNTKSRKKVFKINIMDLKTSILL